MNEWIYIHICYSSYISFLFVVVRVLQFYSILNVNSGINPIQIEFIIYKQTILEEKKKYNQLEINSI